MEIHEFPGVQIHGVNAKVRIGDRYVDLGFYDSKGVFEWSPEGAVLRDNMQAEPDDRDVSTDTTLNLEPVPEVDTSANTELDIDPELAEAKARNAARLKKQRLGRK